MVGICFIEKHAPCNFECTHGMLDYRTFIHCTGISATSTCYLGHLYSYLMKIMLDSRETQVLVFYFCAALNPTFENFPLFHTLSFYTALLNAIISLTYILQKYCK